MLPWPRLWARSFAMPRTSTTTAIEKACKVLLCLSDPGVRRLKDITDRTGIDKASALRVLDCLIAYGLVERDEDAKGYDYGDQFHAIASVLRPRLDIAKLAGPALHRLARVSGDFVYLLVRRGVESVCVACESGGWPIQASTIDVGSRRPLGMGAGSLALLAWQEDAEVGFLLRELAPEVESRLPGRLRELTEELQAARRRGHVLLLDVLLDGVGAIAVPVYGPDGRVAAAIGISSVSRRISERQDQLFNALSKESAHLAEALRQVR
jgi:DNA-binding IclR family transcriptional regulator